MAGRVMNFRLDSYPPHEGGLIRLYIRTTGAHGGVVFGINDQGSWFIALRIASEDGIKEAVLVRNGKRTTTWESDEDDRVIDAEKRIEPLASDEYGYVRVLTRQNNLAWSSPVWGDELEF
jgi:hypothetical protein